jgi:hypothetical protein
MIKSNSPKTMSRDTETPAAHPQMKTLPEARNLLNVVRINRLLKNSVYAQNAVGIFYRNNADFKIVAGC